MSYYTQIEDLPGEIWKDIPGYEGIYRASTKGRIKSLKRYRRCNDKLLTGGTPKKGYSKIILFDNTRHYVHRLVLLTFVGPCPKGMECRHFPDRNPANCCLGNLSWGTHKQNGHDKIVHGTSKRGGRKSSVPMPVLREIHLYYLKGMKQIELARKYKLSRQLINQIVHKK